MEDKKQEKRSSPSVTGFLNQLQRVFRSDEVKQIVVRFLKIIIFDFVEIIDI
jgi:hypothetical protein